MRSSMRARRAKALTECAKQPSRTEGECKERSRQHAKGHPLGYPIWSISILRATAAVRRFGSRVFDQYGIPRQQFNVLRILRGAGPEGLPTLDIAERMIEETPGITRLLDRLELKKLVRRERPSGDRRQ